MDFSGQRISLDAFDVLWEFAMPGLAKPAVLHCESPGCTVDDRGRIVRAVAAQLAWAGYAGRRGVREEASAVLNTLGRPRLAVDIRLYESTGGDQLPVRYGARVAVDGGRGAVAVLGPDGFQAWSFPTGSLVEEVLRLFAKHDPPVRFAGLSLFPDQLGPHQWPSRRHEATLRLLEQPFLRRAHLCVITRGQVGGTDRVSAGLVVNDTLAGRFLVFLDRNQITVAPGNRVTFERKLKEMTEPARR